MVETALSDKRPVFQDDTFVELPEPGFYEHNDELEHLVTCSFSWA